MLVLLIPALELVLVLARVLMPGTDVVLVLHAGTAGADASAGAGAAGSGVFTFVIMAVLI